MNVGPSVTATCHPGDNPLRLLRILARYSDFIIYIHYPKIILLLKAVRHVRG